VPAPFRNRPRAGPVALEGQSRRATHDIAIIQFRRERNRLVGIGDRLVLRCFVTRGIRQLRFGIGQAGVGGGIARIQRNGLAVGRDGATQLSGLPPSPKALPSKSWL
jgi:hypothetical protein